jgi:hypothetical protein
MTQQELNKHVDDELKHIPDWPREHQGPLRAIYNAKRRASLGKNAKIRRSAKEVIEECVARIKQWHPGAEVHYDKEYFACR